MPRPHRISLAAALAVATAGLLVLGAVPASAHTELVRTVPADGSTVTTPPDQLRLVFNEAVRPPSTVVVTGPDGTPVQHGPVEVAGNKVTVAVRATASGTYHVAYRVVSDDGHPVTGETTFTVGTTGSSGSPTTAPPTAGAGHDDHADDVDGSSGFSRGRVIGIGAGIALLAGLALLTVRRLPGGLVDPRGKGSP